MKNGHLSDGQIQEILDAQRTGTNPFIPWHLKSCSLCQKHFQGYQRLYSGLDADPGFALPPAFVDTLLEKIPERQPAWALPAVRIALATGAAAAASVILFLSVDMRPLLTGATRALASLLAAFRLLAAMETFAKLFLFGALGLSSAALVERLLQHQALRRGH